MSDYGDEKMNMYRAKYKIKVEVRVQVAAVQLWSSEWPLSLRPGVVAPVGRLVHRSSHASGASGPQRAAPNLLSHLYDQSTHVLLRMRINRGDNWVCENAIPSVWSSSCSGVRQACAPVRVVVAGKGITVSSLYSRNLPSVVS